jgi:hypothetical protein
MVLVFTADANASPQIRREVERAVNRGVAILPVRIEDVVPGRALEYFIGNVHWLDALTPPLEAHLKNLAGTVKMLLARLDQNSPPVSHAAAGGVLQATKPPEPAVVPPAKPAMIPPAPQSPPQASQVVVPPAPPRMSPQQPPPHVPIPAKTMRSNAPTKGESWVLVVIVVAVLFGLYYVVKRNQQNPGQVPTTQAQPETPGPQAQPAVPAQQPGAPGQGGNDQDLVQAQQFAWKGQPENGQIEITQAQWRNGANVTVQAATLECIQYGSSGQALSQLTRVLKGPAAPGQTITLQPFQLGAEAQGVANMKCGIAAVNLARPGGAPPTSPTPSKAAKPEAKTPEAAPGSAASLRETMKALQSELSNIRTVNYVASGRNPTDGSSLQYAQADQVSNVVADPAQCRVSYHRRVWRNGKVMEDKDAGFLLQGVTSVDVESVGELRAKRTANPDVFPASTTPPVTVLFVKGPNILDDFELTDADLAHRTAATFTQAVKLCGGHLAN